MPQTYVDLSPRPNDLQRQWRKSQMRGLSAYGFQALLASAVGAAGFWYDPQNRLVLYIGLLLLTSAATALILSVLDPMLYERGYALEDRARLEVLIGVLLGAAGAFALFGFFVLAAGTLGLLICVVLFRQLTKASR